MSTKPAKAKAAKPAPAGAGAKARGKAAGVRVVRSAAGICIDGVQGSALVGKYPAVTAQPAPYEPRHFTREEISAAVARHMKLA